MFDFELENGEFSPDYEGFTNEMLNDNPELSESDIEFYEKRKKGFIYYDISLLHDFPKLNNRNIVAETFLKRRKVLKRYEIGYLFNYKGRKYKLYDDLYGRTVGFIPTVDKGCILINKRKITLFDYLFPISIAYIVIKTILSFNG